MRRLRDVGLATLLFAGITTGAIAETLSGQIVCAQCWFEADRAAVRYGNQHDLECAVRCNARGVDTALAVRSGQGFELYTLQGAPPGGGTWLDWTGRFVRLEGRVKALGKPPGQSLRPSSLEPLDESPWPQPAASSAQHDDGDHHDDDVSHGHDADDGSRKDHDDHGTHGEASGHGDSGLVWTDLRDRQIGVEAFRQRLVVLNFWATWCQPCIHEMPDLIRLHDQFAPYGVAFVAAAADPPEQKSTVVEYVREHNINFPVMLGATTLQMQSVGLPPSLPGTVILDEHGHVVQSFAGVIDGKEVEATLAGLIGTGPPARRAAGKRLGRQARNRPGHQHHGNHASLVPS